ncbi:MAG: iron-siderophore ABC transporter substrate-binding protein [Cyanobacteria bacterium P01_A01_bin.116]
MTVPLSQPVRRLLLFLLGLLLAGSFFACGHQKTELASRTQPSDCRQVEHAMGTTCAPKQIERLVTLDTVSFENAVALGLKPIATVDTQRLDSLFTGQLEGVVDIGESGEPNLERVLQLKPDFILGTGEYQQGLYNQASQIAPTAIATFEHSGLWKEVFTLTSQLLGREELGDQVMKDYQQRSQAFQQQLASQPQPTSSSPLQISIVRVYPDATNLYFKESFPGTVVQDAGLARPEPQNLTAKEARALYQNPIQASISAERLDYADGDAIFVWTSENTAEANQTAQEKLTELQARQLWQNLKAVQLDRVYFVPNYWIGNGPIAANAILDDLAKYLVETS